MSELSKTLTHQSGRHIEQVYFDANGDHYFTVRKFEEKDKNGQIVVNQYGKTRKENTTIQTRDGLKSKEITVGVPETKIISTLTREEILEHASLEAPEVKKAADLSLAQKENINALAAKGLLKEKEDQLAAKDEEIEKLKAQLAAHAEGGKTGTEEDLEKE